MSDLQRLQNEVRALRRLVYVLSACATVLAVATVASCAHKQSTVTQLRFVDGAKGVSIDASGVHVANGGAHVDISADRIAAPEVVVGERGPNVTIQPSRLALVDKAALVTLSATADLGARLELANPGNSSLLAYAKANHVDLQMETTAGRFVHAIAADDVSAVEVQQPRMTASLTSTDEDACMGIRHDRPASESTRKDDVVEFCTRHRSEP